MGLWLLEAMHVRVGSSTCVARKAKCSEQVGLANQASANPDHQRSKQGKAETADDLCSPVLVDASFFQRQNVTRSTKCHEM
jgi:hypothetical protein